GPPTRLPSFPTRRSSDLPRRQKGADLSWWMGRSSKPRSATRERGWVGSIPTRSRHFLKPDSERCRRCWDNTHNRKRKVFVCDDRSEEHTSELQSLAYLVC